MRQRAPRLARVAGADSLRVDPDPGAVPADSTGAWVMPDSTTTCTLAATNASDAAGNGGSLMP